MIKFEALPNDFEVRYRFFPVAEGGRNNQAFFQGYRCDWIYADFEEVEPRQAWMIWPIFLDQAGELVPEGAQIANSGTARMMIVDKDLRNTVHRERIRLGIKGFFVEGSRKVAEAMVVRVNELLELD